MLNLTKWCKEISYCNKLANNLFAKRESWNLMVREETAPGFHICDMLCFIVCFPMQSVEKLMVIMCLQHLVQLKTRILFFCDANHVLSCPSSRKLCCQLRPLTPCSNSTSHMGLALANNAGWMTWHWAVRGSIRVWTAITFPPFLQ